MYNQDFYQWTQTQAELLQMNDFRNLDIENLIDEVRSLGKSERRALESYLSVMLLHVLKKQYQPGKATRSWDLSIKHSYKQAMRILRENPSLRTQFEQIFSDAYETARIKAAIETGLDESVFPETCEIEKDQWVNL